MNLQGFCTADSPSWCGHLIHTGSNSASPVHLSSSSAHSYAWPDPCRPLLHPFCLAGDLAFSQSPFCAWTWTKIIHDIIQTCSLTHGADWICYCVSLQINVWPVLWLYLLLTHGAVFHEVADLATDAAAAVIGSHFSLSENFRIKEILLEQMKKNQNFNAFIMPPEYAHVAFTLQILTIWLGYTEGKALTGVPNTVLPLMKAFMMKLVTVLMTKKDTWEDEKIHLKRPSQWDDR